MISLGAADRGRVRRALLVALGSEARASLFFLRSETGFPEEELLRCALGLEREGFVAVEGRPDVNTSRRMVALTARGRRAGTDARDGAEAPKIGESDDSGLRLTGRTKREKEGRGDRRKDRSV